MMTSHFSIESNHGGTKLEFEGEIPRGLVEYDGTSFRVRYTSSDVTAVVEVYDIQPQRWSILFSDIADNWRGWDGVKEHESLEHNLKVSCTADATGHIEMRWTLKGEPAGSNWRVEDSLYLEAGGLAGLAKRAEEYFGT